MPPKSRKTCADDTRGGDPFAADDVSASNTVVVFVVVVVVEVVVDDDDDDDDDDEADDDDAGAPAAAAVAATDDDDEENDDDDDDDDDENRSLDPLESSISNSIEIRRLCWSFVGQFKHTHLHSHQQSIHHVCKQNSSCTPFPTYKRTRIFCVHISSQCASRQLYQPSTSSQTAGTRVQIEQTGFEHPAQVNRGQELQLSPL